MSGPWSHDWTFLANYFPLEDLPMSGPWSHDWTFLANCFPLEDLPMSRPWSHDWTVLANWSLLRISQCLDPGHMTGSSPLRTSELLDPGHMTGMFWLTVTWLGCSKRTILQDTSQIVTYSLIHGGLSPLGLRAVSRRLCSRPFFDFARSNVVVLHAT